MTDRAPTLCVYCASRVGDDPAFAAAAVQVGLELSVRKVDLVFGGGSIGLMGIVADAASEGGRRVIGVMTERLKSKEIGHEGITDLRTVPDMPARKKMMYEEADAFLTLPGGIGTMEEFFEVLTWGYLGLHPKPMGLLNVSGYYDSLLAFFNNAIERGLLSPEVKDHLVIGDDVNAVLDAVLAGIDPNAADLNGTDLSSTGDT